MNVVIAVAGYIILAAVAIIVLAVIAFGAAILLGAMWATLGFMVGA